jgi:AcrR family transcriptional regulator
VERARPSEAVRPAPPTPSAAQQRIIDAAIDLFARHGAGGTSLQMIADRIGVTKAAVYHQYRTKDELIIAVGESELTRLELVLAAAEAQRSQRARRDACIEGIIDLAIERRREVGGILSDPVIGAFFVESATFHDVMHRLRDLLMGDDSTEAQVQTAMLTAAISGAVLHPFVIDMDDDVVRALLLRLARGFLRTSA